MSQPIQTLHDFVLNLITDDGMSTTFLNDPAGTLSGAGLGDVTGMDVQEVAPLVAEHLPAPVADAMESGLAAMPADGMGADGLHCAIAHLQTLASAAQDVPAGLTGMSTSTAFAGDPSGFTGAAALSSGDWQASGSLVGGATGLEGTAVSDTPFGAVTGAVAGPDAPAAGLESPLGTYGFTTDNLSMPSFGSLGDLGGSLDSGAFTDGATATATAAAANYVASGSAGAAAGIATDSSTLAGHLSGVGGMAAQAVATGGDDLATHVASGGAMLSDAVSQLPAVPAPVPLPADVPVHPVAELPQQLPTPAAAVPQVTHSVEAAVSHAPLADAVSQGSLMDAVHSAVPAAEDLHSDLMQGGLPLGH